MKRHASFLAQSEEDGGDETVLQLPELPPELWFLIFCHATDKYPRHLPLQFVTISKQWHDLSAPLFSTALTQWVTHDATSRMSFSIEVRSRVLFFGITEWTITQLRDRLHSCLGESTMQCEYARALYRVIDAGIKSEGVDNDGDSTKPFTPPSLRFYRECARLYTVASVHARYGYNRSANAKLNQIYFLEMTPPIFHLLDADMYVEYMGIKSMRSLRGMRPDNTMDNATKDTNIGDAVFTQRFKFSTTGNGVLSLRSMPVVMGNAPYKFARSQLASHVWKPVLGPARCPVVYDPHYTLSQNHHPLIYDVAIDSELPVEDIRYYLNLLDTMKNVVDAAVCYIVDELVQRWSHSKQQ